MYTDTEGSFLVERVYRIASANVDHIRRVAESSNNPGMFVYYSATHGEHNLALLKISSFM